MIATFVARYCCVWFISNIFSRCPLKPIVWRIVNLWQKVDYWHFCIRHMHRNYIKGTDTLWVNVNNIFHTINANCIHTPYCHGLQRMFDIFQAGVREWHGSLYYFLCVASGWREGLVIHMKQAITSAWRIWKNGCQQMRKGTGKILFLIV